MSKVFDPLHLDVVGESIVAAVLGSNAIELPPANRQAGAGVYLLYYCGPFELYAPISSRGWHTPIYAGKADAAGARTGRAVPSGSAALHRRLRQHVESIDAADNLEVVDFRCRYLLLDPVWIGLGEQMLIKRFQPLWNTVVQGFGIRDPGKGRQGQRKSDWDVLHPGRHYANNLQDPTGTRRSLEREIANHFARLPGM